MEADPREGWRGGGGEVVVTDAREGGSLLFRDRAVATMAAVASRHDPADVGAPLLEGVLHDRCWKRELLQASFSAFLRSLVVVFALSCRVLPLNSISKSK